jgi:hypothetical protein
MLRKNGKTAWVKELVLQNIEVSWEVADSAIMMKGKWPFMNGCEYVKPIPVATKFLNSSYEGVNASTFSKIMLKNNASSRE